MADDSSNDESPEVTGPVNCVLVVARDGSIKATLQSGDNNTGKDPAIEKAERIDAIWGGGIGVRISRNIRRVLRDRCYCSDEIREGEGGTNAEFIFVAQGRDSALVVVRDLANRDGELTRMHKLAYIDETTGLPNRELFLIELKNIIEFQQLREGRIAVMTIHIDKIDESRGAFGPAQQDAVFAELAQRLRKDLRGANSDDKSDYDRRSVIARTDFRDFAIILPSIESGADAEAVAERVIASIARPVRVGNRDLKLKAYAGIALYPQDGAEAEALFENAVAAMEDASCSHDIDVKFHTGTVKLRTLQRQDLELELKTALDTEEFDVNYQPVVDAKTGRIRSVEALLRWPESILGTQSTRKIVSIAERTSLIVAIGTWVLRRSCEQLKTWKDKGYESLRLSFNISPQEFSRSDLAQSISAALIRAGLQPSDLDIEINEHILFRDAMKNYSTCRALKRLGVGLVVDDYGIGSCSLAHLSHSPVDTIKIDNALVAHLETSGRDNAACDAAISMAHALGLEVIAEGVETEEQARLLTDLGCDMLQGYHYYSPMSGDEIAGFLELSATGRRTRIVRGA
ncbi:MAG: bifunctional diguanylate cyclase/phosphodiesterase [Woeseiaceae bacterium]|nr:bifunctional diguanylate cyclase/phosphodiesterase [Woeseiaceae bacterium]